MRHLLHCILAAPLVGALLVFSLAACSSTSDAPEGLELYNVDEHGLGLEGYDPVSYFPEGGAVPRKGNPAHAASHDGIVYHFVGEANLRRFRAEPERYVPAYGGWCAWAMAEGDNVDIDPESYLIRDGRLLVFYDGFFGDTRAKWLERDQSELADRADRHWAEVRSE